MTIALKCAGKVLDLNKPCVMGILNVTPDSFSDGGLFVSTDSALRQVKKMIDAGATFVDIGGESTRPGAQAVSIEEERRRVLPIVEFIKTQFPDVLISVDTSKPDIMADVIKAGAHLINDVNALRAPRALDIVADSDVAVCLMHMQGEPRTMQQNPHYENVVQEVYDYLQQRIESCIKAGIDKQRIVIDPGFGFGKSLQHNLLLVKNLQLFRQLGVAVLVGVSRKSMIGAILDKPVTERLSGSIALASLSLWLGADIVRAHDVEPTVDAIKIIDAVKSVNI